jgi:tripartite-type tricarboxylate transporter receptor subunit TctC
MLIVPPRALLPPALSRRRFMRDLAILLASAGAAPVFAQSTGDYPVRPIHFVIPNTVGGTSDILARLIGSRLSDAIGQPVIVESRPGAAGRIALDYMGKACWETMAPTRSSRVRRVSTPPTIQRSFR